MIASLQNHPFCRFSDQVTKRAEDALLALKNRHDLNTDLILFCHWFAANNQGLLSKIEMKRLLTTIYTWHQKIVAPLYTLCNQLQRSITLDLWTLEDSAYEDAKNALTTAQRIEQLFLADVLPKKSRRSRTSLIQIATHACINISHYCQSVYISLNEIDYQDFSIITAAAFPDMDSNKMLSFVRGILGERQAKQPLQKSLPLVVFA